MGVVSQHLVNSRNVHWSIVERIMQYLKRTSNHGLLYKGGSIQNLLPKTNVICHGQINGDWVDDIDIRKSTYGYVFILFLATISWTNKRQITTAHSSTKAKYMIYTLDAKEAIWLCLFLCDLGEEQAEFTVIHGDNQSVIVLVENPKFHSCSKHIKLQFYFIQAKVSSGEIQLKYCSTKAMVTNILTKSLPKENHDFCTQNANIVSFSYNNIESFTYPNLVGVLNSKLV